MVEFAFPVEGGEVHVLSSVYRRRPSQRFVENTQGIWQGPQICAHKCQVKSREAQKDEFSILKVRTFTFLGGARLKEGPMGPDVNILSHCKDKKLIS